MYQYILKDKENTYGRNQGNCDGARKRDGVGIVRFGCWISMGGIAFCRCFNRCSVSCLSCGSGRSPDWNGIVRPILSPVVHAHGELVELE